MPSTFAELERLCVQISNSDWCPKDLRSKPGSIMVAIQHGIEIGLMPMQALQNVAPINGKPSIYGDAALAVCRAHPRFSKIEERAPDEALKAQCGECTITTSDGGRVTRRFSVEDAKRAGLWGKQGPWTNYPGRMLQMRARSWAMRDALPEALKGIAIREEQEDVPVTARTMPTTTKPSEALSSEPPPIDVTATPTDPDPAPGMSEDEKALVVAIERIDACSTVADLRLLVKDFERLPDSVKPAARTAYEAKRTELSQ